MLPRWAARGSVRCTDGPADHEPRKQVEDDGQIELPSLRHGILRECSVASRLRSLRSPLRGLDPPCALARARTHRSDGEAASPRDHEMGVEELRAVASAMTADVDERRGECSGKGDVSLLESGLARGAKHLLANAAGGDV